MRYIVLVLALCSPAYGIATYHIGNSLTYDSRPKIVAEIAELNGLDHSVGQHIRCSSPLQGIWNNPEETCVAPTSHGTFTTALPGYEWDAITLQPYPNSNLGTDEAMIKNFVDLLHENAANTDTRIYIYAAWPKASDDYAVNWLASTSDSDGQSIRRARSYYDHLKSRLISDGVDAELIPVGEVLYEVDQRLRSGALVIDGYSDVGDFYRDDLHLAPIGRFVATMTTLAVLHDADVRGMQTVHFDDLDAQTQLALQTVVYDVVSVPEPGSLILVVIGGALLMRRQTNSTAKSPRTCGVPA